jgi:hypothetical protein
MMRCGKRGAQRFEPSMSFLIAPIDQSELAGAAQGRRSWRIIEPGG